MSIANTYFRQNGAETWRASDAIRRLALDMTCQEMALGVFRCDIILALTYLRCIALIFYRKASYGEKT